MKVHADVYLICIVFYLLLQHDDEAIKRRGGHDSLFNSKH